MAGFPDFFNTNLYRFRLCVTFKFAGIVKIRTLIARTNAAPFKFSFVESLTQRFPYATGVFLHRFEINVRGGLLGLLSLSGDGAKAK